MWLIILKKNGILIYFIPFIILLSFLIGAYSDFTRKISDEESRMIHNFALTESKINEVTNQNISKMLGLATHISTNTDIDVEDGFLTNDIPVQSRIIAIADAFDAMTSKRTYQDILSHEKALAEITDNAKTQFDPDLVEIFRMHFDEIIKGC